MLSWTDATVNALLRRISAVCGPARFNPLYRVLRVLAVAGVKEHFASGIGPDGRPWKPPVARSGKPLLSSGQLVGSVREAGAVPSLRLVSALIYAPVHQYSAVIHKPERRRGVGEKPWVFQGREGIVFPRHIRAHTVFIPARPFLGISTATAAKMGAAAEKIALRPTLAELVREKPSATRNARIREVAALLRIVRSGRLAPAGVKVA